MISHKLATRAPSAGRSAKTGRSRQGFVVSIELALVLPVLLLVLLALLEFSLLLFARSAVVEASRVGARKATLLGASATGVADDVRRVLARYPLSRNATVAVGPLETLAGP